MPITGAGVSGINVEITGRADDLIAEINKTNKSLDQFKQKIKDEKAALAEQAKQVKSATMSWTDFRSMYQTVLDVVRVGQQVWNASIDKFIDYTEQIRRVQRVMGGDVENASRLIQVADDVGVSFEQMALAMRMATKNGVDVSVDSLAKLADQFIAIESPIDRAKFAQKIFGENWEAMIPILEKSGAGVKDLYDGIDDGLIATEAGAAAVDQYKISIDELGEEYDAFINQVAPPFLDFLNQALMGWRIILEMADQMDKIDFSKGEVFKQIAIIHDSIKDTLEADDALKKFIKTEGGIPGEVDPATDALEKETEALDLLKDAAQITSDALEEISQRNQDIISTVEKFASLNKSHADEMADAYDELKNKQEDLAEAQKKGDVKGIKRATEAINEQRETISGLVVDYVNAGDAIVYEMIKAELAIGGLTDAEYLLTLEAGKAFGVITDADIAMAQAAMTERNAFIDAAKASGQLGNEVDAATNKIIFDMMLAKLAVDGLTDAEFQAALEVGKNLGVISDAAIQVAKDQQEAANELIAGTGLTTPEETTVDTTNATVDTSDTVINSGATTVSGDGVTVESGMVTINGTAVTLDQEQVTQAIQDSIDKQDRFTQSLEVTYSVIRNEAVAVENVSVSVRDLTFWQDRFTQSSEVTYSVIRNEALAVDNVVLSIQNAIMTQNALTNSIWQSVSAQNALNSAVSSGGTIAPSMDSGGVGRAGQEYMIGTGAQPERFTPLTNGVFTPNAGRAGNSGSSHSVTVNIHNPTGQSSDNSIRKELKKLSYLGVLR